ncbi:MAG: hypothetical protein QGF09_10590 [Rhodospirillales bacterium]|jgi:hypothetical protein|nr:hypothetical protein [Rhodospirillales bacterium]
MTKAKARKRAKAKAAVKSRKPAAKGDQQDTKSRAGIFDNKANSNWNMGRGADIKNQGAMRRGAARSR